jgi:micrococcal nuclease
LDFMPDANNGGMSDMKFQIIATLLLCAPLLLSHDFNGRVVAISDGDTVRVMHEGRSEKIRLYGIDAPERGQAFSSRAKQFVSGLCFGKEVTVKARGQDRYQRTIADVILPDGRNLNHEIVRAGFAWWFRKYAPGDETLERLEKEARQARLGLWVDQQSPIPPWEWRKASRYQLAN